MEARRGSPTVGEGTFAAAGKRRNNASRRYRADAVASALCNVQGAARPKREAPGVELRWGLRIMKGK